MRTTLNLDDRLMAQALQVAKLTRKTEVIHLGLQLIVQREAGLRLACRGGTDPAARAAPRRKSRPAE
jgi:Arc/MetJ family transcription regulator